MIEEDNFLMTSWSGMREKCTTADMKEGIPNQIVLKDDGTQIAHLLDQLQSSIEKLRTLREKLKTKKYLDNGKVMVVWNANISRSWCR